MRHPKAISRARRLCCFVAVAAALFGLAGTGGRAQTDDAQTIKIATLFPRSSPWGMVFNTWAKAVSEKSGGKLTLEVLYNGREGDEAAVATKVKEGQLGGALVSEVGLGKIHRPILALRMPGLFASWDELDRARGALKPELEKGAGDAGFVIVGWSDFGVCRIMSKGFAVKAPADIRGKRPYLRRGDDIQLALYDVVGAVTPVPLDTSEVHPGLSAGTVNVVEATALHAEQLQWNLDHISSDGNSYAIGAIVLSSKLLNSLPEERRNILLDTGKIAAVAMNLRIRSEDGAAVARLKGKMTLVEPTADDRAKWDETYRKVRGRLAQGTFPPALVTKLEGLRNSPSK